MTRPDHITDSLSLYLLSAQRHRKWCVKCLLNILTSIAGIHSCTYARVFLVCLLIYASRRHTVCNILSIFSYVGGGLRKRQRNPNICRPRYEHISFWGFWVWFCSIVWRRLQFSRIISKSLDGVANALRSRQIQWLRARCESYFCLWCLCVCVCSVLAERPLDKTSMQSDRQADTERDTERYYAPLCTAVVTINIFPLTTTENPTHDDESVSCSSWNWPKISQPLKPTEMCVRVCVLKLDCANTWNWSAHSGRVFRSVCVKWGGGTCITVQRAKNYVVQMRPG